METVYIVLIVATAIVLLVVAWLYRDRLTRGWFKGSKGGVEAGLEAAPPAESPTAPPATGEQTTEEGPPPAPAGVRLKGDFRRATISGLAGRDIVRGEPSAPRRGGQTPGVELDGRFPDAEVRDLAGRDIIEATNEEKDDPAED